MTQETGRPTNSLVFLVGRLDGKMDQVILGQTATAARFDNIEGRLERHDRLFNYAAGGGAVVVFLVTAWEVVRYFNLP